MSDLSTSQLDQIISEKFRASFMSDTKWDKLIDGLTDVFEEVFVKYKLIHGNDIFQTSFDSPDFEPFFIEPILYKEVEWMEFPAKYEDYVNRNNLKAGKKTYDQDIKLIERAIINIGQYEIENSVDGVRVYSYR